MKQKHRKLIPTIWILSFLTIYAYCRHYLSFNYFFVEQFTFFRFSKEYAVATLSQPGGLASYLGDFFNQFYLYAEIGPLISAALVVLLTALLDLSLKQLSPEHYIPLLSTLPALVCIWIETDHNYYLSGTISLVLSLSVFLIYLRILRRLSFYVRLVLLMFFSWPIYFLLGPNALLMVLLCVLVELQKSSKKTYFCILALPVAIACPVTMYFSEQGKSLVDQLLPSGYYLDILETPLLCYMPWVTVIMNIILVRIVFTFMDKKVGKHFSLYEYITHSAWVIGAQFIVLIGIMHFGVREFNSSTNYEAKIFDYFVRTEKWTELLNSKYLRSDKNYMHTCYQNLALSALNLMGDKMFSCPQPGFPGLIINWNKAVNTSTLLSDVCWQAGDVALAQNLAFEGIVASREGVNPRLLLRLVQTNLVEGNYHVAEKYISLLSDTYAYAERVYSYRQMLYNDEAVKSDPELGPRRIAMNGAKGLTSNNRFIEDLSIIIKNNPTFIPAYHYFGGACLLLKDINLFKQFIEHYHSAAALTDMPVHFQEAVILAFGKEKERWKEFGVSLQTEKKFEQYRKIFMEYRNSPLLESKMAANFRSTYWYYFMFKNNKK